MALHLVNFILCNPHNNPTDSYFEVKKLQLLEFPNLPKGLELVCGEKF